MSKQVVENRHEKYTSSQHQSAAKMCVAVNSFRAEKLTVPPPIPLLFYDS